MTEGEMLGSSQQKLTPFLTFISEYISIKSHQTRLAPMKVIKAKASEHFSPIETPYDAIMALREICDLAKPKNLDGPSIDESM